MTFADFAERIGLKAKAEPKPTPRQSFRAEDTPAELIEALARADYSHLPELHTAGK